MTVIAIKSAESVCVCVCIVLSVKVSWKFLHGLFAPLLCLPP